MINMHASFFCSFSSHRKLTSFKTFIAWGIMASFSSHVRTLETKYRDNERVRRFLFDKVSNIWQRPGLDKAQAAEAFKEVESKCIPGLWRHYLTMTFNGEAYSMAYSETLSD